MTDWQPLKTAPKDGSPVLLWARLGSHPPEGESFFPIVGFWHRSVGRWKVAPEVLNAPEDLIPTYWAPSPKPPGQGRAAQ